MPLQEIDIDRPRTSARRLIPPLLQPLIDARDRGEDARPLVTQFARSFGFDTFFYAYTNSATPLHEAQLYVYSTCPREWFRIYDENHYIEIDPRFALAREGASAVVWDQSSERDQDPAVDAFLDACGQYGICSSIVSYFHREAQSSFMVALNSPRPVIDPLWRSMIARNVGDFQAFALGFHDAFMSDIVGGSLQAQWRLGQPLIRREREILELAADGQSNDEIALFFATTERAIRQSFDAIRAKLGAKNRTEAVAMAIRANLIQGFTRPALVREPLAGLPAVAAASP